MTADARLVNLIADAVAAAYAETGPWVRPDQIAAALAPHVVPIERVSALEDALTALIEAVESGCAIGAALDTARPLLGELGEST